MSWRGQVLFLVSRQPLAKFAGEYPFKSVWPFVADRKIWGTSCKFLPSWPQNDHCHWVLENAYVYIYIHIIHNTMALPFSTTQFLVRIHAKIQSLDTSTSCILLPPNLLWIPRPSCNFFEIISRCGPPTCKIPAVPWVLDRWLCVGRIRRNGRQPVVRGGS